VSQKGDERLSQLIERNSHLGTFLRIPISRIQLYRNGVKHELPVSKGAFPIVDLVENGAIIVAQFLKENVKKACIISA
jgi:hypothetical protein